MLKIILTIFIGLIGWSVERIIVWINRRVQESKFIENVTKAKEIVQSVVEKLYQTIVEKEKEAGVFTTIRQRQVLQMAVEQSRRYMNKSLQHFLVKEYKDIRIWLQTQIEATIYRLKHNAAEKDYLCM